MPTLKQFRLISELPNYNWKIEPAMKAAGYSISHARHNQKIVVKSRGVQELLANIGIDEKRLLQEYLSIAVQNEDLRNKRVVIEKILGI